MTYNEAAQKRLVLEKTRQFDNECNKRILIIAPELDDDIYRYLLARFEEMKRLRPKEANFDTIPVCDYTSNDSYSIIWIRHGPGVLVILDYEKEI
ncbi:hypothetical protein [Flavobacterium microcysteis]